MEGRVQAGRWQPQRVRAVHGGGQPMRRVQVLQGQRWRGAARAVGRCCCLLTR